MWAKNLKIKCVLYNTQIRFLLQQGSANLTKNFCHIYIMLSKKLKELRVKALKLTYN